VAEPGIRASLTGIWINVTVMPPIKASHHPLLTQTNPSLSFSSLRLKSALGRLEKRSRILSTKDKVYQKMFASFPHKHLLAATGMDNDPYKALQIHRNLPIYVYVNVIKNPLLNAEITAQYVVKSLEANKSVTLLP
jgi:hypothetical protein